MSVSNTMSVQEYKQVFDRNNYKTNSYEVALFIDFLMKKDKLIREMEELTGLKKSQIHSYKKIIKSGRTEELRNNPFRKVLKDCTNPRPVVEEELVEEIEKMNLKRERSYEGAHFFNEVEFSSDRTSFRRNDFCPCGLETNTAPRGQKLVHIPYLNFTTTTFLSLEEITEHAEQVRDLEARVKELEARVKEVEDENKNLKAERQPEATRKKFLLDALKASG